MSVFGPQALDDLQRDEKIWSQTQLEVVYLFCYWSPYLIIHLHNPERLLAAAEALRASSQRPSSSPREGSVFESLLWWTRILLSASLSLLSLVCLEGSTHWLMLPSSPDAPVHVLRSLRTLPLQERFAHTGGAQLPYIFWIIRTTGCCFWLFTGLRYKKKSWCWFLMRISAAMAWISGGCSSSKPHTH